MNSLTSRIQQTWQSAQLYIIFHRDQKGTMRKEPKVWPPNNANALIHSDPAEKEVIVTLKSTTKKANQDVQIKLRPDKIVLRRDFDNAWNGVLIREHSVSVAVAGITINIDHDGSLTREDGNNTTWVEADGSVLKKTEFAEASMSNNGVDLSRRTPDNVATIRADGILSKNR